MEILTVSVCVLFFVVSVVLYFVCRNLIKSSQSIIDDLNKQVGALQGRAMNQKILDRFIDIGLRGNSVAVCDRALSEREVKYIYNKINQITKITDEEYRNGWKKSRAL